MAIALRSPSLLRSSAAPRGGLTSAEAPLIDAEFLFRQPGPAQTERRVLMAAACPFRAITRSAQRPVVHLSPFKGGQRNAARRMWSLEFQLLRPIAGAWKVS